MRSRGDAPQLVEEIGLERIRVAITLQSLRKEMAIASLGLMVSQFIGRKRWLRIASLVALAVSLGRPLLAHFFPARR